MDLMTTGEVARRFGVSPDAVRNWTRRGLLAAARTETGVRVYRRVDVEQLAEARGNDKDGSRDRK